MHDYCTKTQGQTVKKDGLVTDPQATPARGWVRKLPSGRFQARLNFGHGKLVKAPSTFTAEHEAWAWVNHQLEQIEQGTWTPPTEQPRRARLSPTVGSLVKQWLKECERGITTGEFRLSSVTTYKITAEKRILNYPPLANCRVDELTRRDVHDWWDHLQETYPNTPDRNKRAYFKLRSVLETAVDNELIAANPVNIRAARKNKPRVDKQLPTTQELRGILEHTLPRYKLATCLCLFHGLRIGEALGLQAKHVTRDGHGGWMVRVEQTTCRVPDENGHIVININPPKTRAGYRTVPVLPEFNPLFEQHFSTRQFQPEDFVTTTSRGNMIIDTSYRVMFHRAREAAGITKRITPHYGRNWLITRLAESGATPKEIGRILGQQDTKTIVDVYMKVRESRSQRIMSELDISDMIS